MRGWLLLLAGLLAAFLLLVAFAVGLNGSDPRVRQALVAGLFIAVGWLATFLLRETGDAIGRDRRRRDIMRALRAEISDYVETVDFNRAEEDRAAGADVAERVRAGGDDAATAYRPFIATEPDALLFNAFIAEIAILPEACVEPVVAFYIQLRDVAVFASDLSVATERLPAERRALMYEDYIAMRINAYKRGARAIRTLDAELADGSEWHRMRARLGWQR